MKGIILAGGKGSRLSPITKVVNKHLLPIYDKPMIYYPLGLLLHLGIFDITVICNSEDKDDFKKLLSIFKNFNFKLSFVIQQKQMGIPSAVLSLPEKFYKENLLVILGDNLFLANSLSGTYIAPSIKNGIKYSKAIVFSATTKDPSGYGVVERYKSKKVKKLIEKPKTFVSNEALTGLYFFPKNWNVFFNGLKLSDRNETEIVDVLNNYLKCESLLVNKFGRGVSWLDAGVPENIFMASEIVRTLQTRQGLGLGFIEEIAFEQKLVGKKALKKSIKNNPTSEYNDYLKSFLNESK